MIEIILLFGLGFLSAGFLALLFAPLYWRRALTLTRKRMEGQAPMSMSEIRADKDRLRAEFAIARRKIEMSAEAATKQAQARTIEIDRQRGELSDLRAERDAQAAMLKDLETRIGALDAEATGRREELEELLGRHGQLQDQLAEKSRAFDELDGLHEELTYTSSSRQIEIVARETEIDNLKQDMAELRHERDRATRRAEELTAQNAALEARLAQPSETGEGLPGGESVGATPKDERLGARNRRLETRLAALVRENKKLRMRLEAPRDAGDPEAAGDRDAMLREKLSQLAAEVVHMTARLEGPASSLDETLHAEPRGPGEAEAAGSAPSLADRIRALQKTASAEN